VRETGSQRFLDKASIVAKFISGRKWQSFHGRATPKVIIPYKYLKSSLQRLWIHHHQCSVRAWALVLQVLMTRTSSGGTPW
jgi:hypothetical protein